MTEIRTFAKEAGEYVLLVPIQHKVELRYTITIDGEQSVMMDLIQMMRELRVQISASVGQEHPIQLEEVVDKYGWMTWLVLDMNQHYQAVVPRPGEFTIVIMVKM